MIATLILEQLRASGMDLSLSPAGKLHIESSAGTVTDRLQLPEHRKERVEALSTGSAAHRAGDDPRPHLTYDAEGWTHLLDKAVASDRENGEGVYVGIARSSLHRC